MSMDRFGVHKDSSALDTISRARRTLEEVGIALIERPWSDFGAHNHSLTLEDIDNPTVSSSGKGVTKPLALASGYAEFLERVQNLMKYQKTFGLMQEVSVTYPDEKAVPLSQLIRDDRELLDVFFDGDLEPFKPFEDDQGRIRCVPFFDVDRLAIAFVPWLPLRVLCCNNGTCAGNTYEEALSQGLCELFERYALRKFFSDDRPFPELPAAAIEQLECAALVEEFRKEGYQLVFKDMTLGGAIPVVGVVLVNKTRGGYLVSVGSDPLFETAVQRCLTEVVQNRSELGRQLSPLSLSDRPYATGPFSTEAKNRLFNMIHFPRYGRAIFPPGLVMHKEASPQYCQAFLPRFRDHKETLRFLVEKVQSNGWRLLVRDVSFLGFPALQAFIPGVSNLGALPPYLHQYLEMKKRLLKIPRLTDQELRETVDVLEKSFDEPRWWWRFPSRLSVHGNFGDLFHNNWLEDGIDLDEKCTLRKLPLILVLVMIYRRLGDDQKVFHSLDRAVTELLPKLLDVTAGAPADDGGNQPGGDVRLLQAAFLYYRYKLAGWSEDEIRKGVAPTFGGELGVTIAGFGSLSLQLLESIWPLPNCGHCPECAVQASCYYPSWKSVALKLKARMQESFPRQSELARLFKA